MSNKTIKTKLLFDKEYINSFLEIVSRILCKFLFPVN